MDVRDLNIDLVSSLIPVPATDMEKMLFSEKIFYRLKLIASAREQNQASEIDRPLPTPLHFGNFHTLSSKIFLGLLK